MAYWNQVISIFPCCTYQAAKDRTSSWLQSQFGVVVPWAQRRATWNQTKDGQIKRSGMKTWISSRLSVPLFLDVLIWEQKKHISVVFSNQTYWLTSWIKSCWPSVNCRCASTGAFTASLWKQKLPQEALPLAGKQGANWGCWGCACITEASFVEALPSTLCWKRRVRVAAGENRALQTERSHVDAAMGTWRTWCAGVTSQHWFQCCTKNQWW